MDLPLFIEHASACAPQIEAVTLAKIAKQESALRPWALSVNYPVGTARKLGEPGGYARLDKQPRTKAQAVHWATRLVEQGHTVSFGLMQISSQNLARLGYTLEQAFEPCTNIQIAGALLSEKLARARQLAPDDPLPTALSLYNSGDRWMGFNNGYVSGVLNQSVTHAGRRGQEAGPVTARAPATLLRAAPASTATAEAKPAARRVVDSLPAMPTGYRAALAAPTRVVWNKP